MSVDGATEGYRFLHTMLRGCRAPEVTRIATKRDSKRSARSVRPTNSAEEAFSLAWRKKRVGSEMGVRAIRASGLVESSTRRCDVVADGPYRRSIAQNNSLLGKLSAAALVHATRIP